MPTDAFEMAVVHRIFRRELGSAPQLISSVEAGQRTHLKRVAEHLSNILAALHHHHIAEDERLWPMLHARVPLHAQDIQRMEIEHELIAKSVDSVISRLSEWIATASTTPPLASQLQAAETLVTEVKELTELVGDHLSAEEGLVVPLINEYLTDAEWRAVTKRGGSFISRNIRFATAFVGMALESCTPDERRRFLAGMRPAERLLVRLVARRTAASYRARLERTH